MNLSNWEIIASFYHSFDRELCLFNMGVTSINKGKLTHYEFQHGSGSGDECICSYGSWGGSGSGFGNGFGFGLRDGTGESDGDGEGAGEGYENGTGW